MPNLFSKIISNPGEAIRRGPGWTLWRLSEWTGGWPFHLQSQMDIDPTGYSYNTEFVRETGGFFPRGDGAARSIAPFDVKDRVQRNMLLLLMRSIVERGVEGDLAEVGVYKGMSARLIHEYLPERTLRLFDTFGGFAEHDLSVERPQDRSEQLTTMFADTSVDAVRAYVGSRRPENLVLRVGRFPESATDDDAAQRYAFVHLDADLYAPMKSGLEFFYPRLALGGFIVCHDYNAWAGSRRAVDEFCGASGAVPIPFPDKAGSVLIVKH